MRRGDVDLRPLAGCRLAIGTLIVLRTTPLLLPLDIPWMRSSAPLLGWPHGGFTLAWLPPIAVQGLCIARTISALLFMVGFRTRVSGITCGLCGYLVACQYPLGFFFTLHLLYQAAVLLALTDSGAVLAMRPEAVRGPSSGLWMVRAFVASIYFWAGLYKLRPDWLDGRTLEVLHQEGALEGPIADFVLDHSRLRVAAIAVPLLELGLGPLLLWTRTRRVALVVAYAFHVGLELIGHPDMLGWGMMALLLSFTGGGERRRGELLGPSEPFR